MRILHVATLVTPDGAYGGPVRVAINQLRELARLGHDVELVAGSQGYEGQLPSSIEGVAVRLFPARSVAPGLGYASLRSPGVQRYVQTRLKEVDIVHVHIARDLITLPAALSAVRSDRPVVLQPHGMIDESTRILARVLDLAATKRTLGSANVVLSLTPEESSSLRAVAGDRNLNIQRISNGLRIPTSRPEPGGAPEVLFLARLHPRKRALHFVNMAVQLIHEGSPAKFTLVGPDEGDGPAVRNLIADHNLDSRIVWEGSLSPEKTLQRMADASVYVLPAVHEVFPMSVLEALSLGVPTVITSSNGLAPLLQAKGAAVVVDETLAGMVAGTRSLLEDASLRRSVGERGRATAMSDFSIEAVAERLEQLYDEARHDNRITTRDGNHS